MGIHPPLSRCVRRRSMWTATASVVLLCLSTPAETASPYSVVDPVSLGIVSVTRNTSQSPRSDRWAADQLFDGADARSAVPTNAWWLNFALGRGPQEGADANVFAIPFILWGAENGINAAMPFVLTMSDHVENAFDDKVMCVSLGAEGIKTGQHIAAHDAFSVRLVWGSTEDQHGFIASPVVRGSPYVTMEYYAAKPVFSAPMMLDPQHGLKVDGVEQKCDGAVTGTKFELGFVQSDETWTLWASQQLKMTCSGKSITSLTSSEPLTGVIRVAMTNNCTFGRSAHHCPTTPPSAPQPGFGQILQQHHGVYPSGGRVDLLTEGDDAFLQIYWDVKHMPNAQMNQTLLLTAMEHHRQLGLCGSNGALLEGAQDVFQKNINGRLTLVIGNQWIVPYALPPVSWSSLRGVAEDFSHTLLANLLKDADWDLPANYLSGAGDPYNAGKLLARMATVALIAKEMGRTDIAQRMGTRLQGLVQLYASGKALNKFVYDGTWGGIVSCGCLYDIGSDGKAYCKNSGPNNVDGVTAGCPALTDPGMDFGNGFFNDHHFQWGYHIYAAAVAAHLDPAWGQQNKEYLLLYARDIANPDAADKHFPVWRHKDWYTGWSWASGFALGGDRPYRNGRNQESTSESINGYFGLQLLGDALGMSSLKDWGRAAMASEIVSTQIYWQIKDQTVYGKDFATKTLVGILWQNLAQYQTWFGGSPYMIHGIQMLPFTSVSEFYLQPRWVSQSYEIGSKDCHAQPGCSQMGWSSLFVGEKAVIDPQQAWYDANALPDQAFDGPAGNGISRTAVLFWIATRPQLQEPKQEVMVWPRILQCSAISSPQYAMKSAVANLAADFEEPTAAGAPLWAWVLIFGFLLVAFGLCVALMHTVRSKDADSGSDEESSGSGCE